MATAPAEPARAAAEAGRALPVLIRPAAGRPGLLGEVREFWKYRYLVKVLVGRELRVRYKNSVLGIAWSMVNPLVSVFVLTVFVGYILGAGPRNLSAYILCAYIPWTFFQTSVLDASSSVLSQASLLKKVYFPREIPVIAAVCANGVHFFFALIVFIVYRWGVMTWIYGWPGWPPLSVLWLPVVTVILFLLTLGISFFVSAWNVFYEDVKFVVSSLLSFVFYLLPIVYFAENINYSQRIPKHMQWWAYHLYLGNPLAWIVTAFKQMFFSPQNIAGRSSAPILSAPFDWRYLAITLVLSCLISVAGYAHFNSYKWKFTERP